MTSGNDDYALLVATVREAGSLAMQYFQTDVKVWEKEGGTPVSDADIAVNTLIQRRLGEARPDYGWLSEETADDPARLDRRRVWVVDPIDGTRAFLQGVPHFCHAVALVEDGRPIAAALYNPAAAEFYEAAAGQGAKLNGQPIHVSDRHEIAGCRMAAFAPLFRHPAWREAWPKMDIIQRDSVAYRLALVASGVADAALGLNAKYDWDWPLPISSFMKPAGLSVHIPVSCSPTTGLSRCIGVFSRPGRPCMLRCSPGHRQRQLPGDRISS